MQIRNFSIVAHIDHGKSTLSDRLLMRAGAITEREFHNQILDDMDLERERGITIKASAVTVFHEHTYPDGRQEKFMLNFIDTPGHVDFHYEVQKALQACEGAILVVDSTQGVQAQTVANAYAAVEVGLEIVPVINKIDLPSADAGAGGRGDRASARLPGRGRDPGLGQDGAGHRRADHGPVRQAAAADGQGGRATRALIFDSLYDDYRGVIVYVRVVDGELKKGQKIRLMGAGKEYAVSDLGKLVPRPVRVESDRHRRGRVHRGGHQGPARRPHRRHGDRRRPAGGRGAAGLQAGPADGLLRLLPRRQKRSTTSCATPWTACS